MPTSKRKTSSSKRNKRSKAKTARSPSIKQSKTGNKTSTRRSSTGTRQTRGKRPRKARSSNVESITYVFECTRQGCGYRIVREEKAEPGQLRFDIKCPKCHNEEFRCLGKGDLPTQNLVLPPSPVELDLGDSTGTVSVN